jgi:glutamyl-Q tRNA(Asp) synthetase
MYRGRFAPSPTGPLHAGSLVAALASWLDARAAGGQWLVRIENVDTPRCVPGTDHLILKQLQACGLVPDEPPVWQSSRTGHYQQALDALVRDGLAYPCGCSRKDIEAALQRQYPDQGNTRVRHGELIYPGTCRAGAGPRPARAWRLNTGKVQKSTSNRPSALVNTAQTAIDLIADEAIHWHDRRLGEQQQNVASQVGDFVLHRADGLFAYQLAVVVDDAAQGVTHVVRGADLADNTARQILLQRALGLPTPGYLHTPLVLGTQGEKLSKQNGAQALNTTDPLAALNQAASVLGLAQQGPTRDGQHVSDALTAWVRAWRHLYNLAL